MRDFRSCFKGLLKTQHPFLWKIAAYTLLETVLVAVALGLVWISEKVVDIATGASDGPLGESVGVFVGLLVLQLTCRVASRYLQGYIVVNAQNSIRARLFEKVLRSTWTGKDKLHSGDTISRLEEDIRVVTDFICVSFPQCVVTLVQLVAASFFLYQRSPKLTWLLLVIMPLAVLASRLFFKKMRAITGEIRAGDARVQGHMQENLQHRVLVKTLGSTERVLERLGFYQEDVRRNTMRRLNYNAISRSFMLFGFSAGYALVFLWGVFGLRAGTITYGMMVAFLQLVGQVQRPVANFAQMVPAFIRALSSEERLMELDELEQEADVADVIVPGAPGIKVEDLSFTYEGANAKTIRGLSFDFKPGTMTAILGPTGAGKSTLVRVIMALLKPDAGKVMIYGDGICVDSDTSTRCNFMYVPQGNSLMSGSIAENLRMAKPDASDEELRAALHLAAADFVYELQDGLETTCAEKGNGLSEGQAQRIAIARALLRPGGILILDEATSALDAETERELLQRIADSCHGSKTILCITHRPAATSYADAELRID